MTYRAIPIVLVSSLLLVLALVLTLPAGPALAGPRPAQQPPDRPSVTPPPRPTATAVPTPQPHAAEGGAIWLHCEGHEPGEPPLHAVVQWQDGLGDWHDVTGWKGRVNGTEVVWYVDETDFDTGPFRWVVRRGENDAGISSSFMLPHASGQVVRVTVQVGR